MIAQSAGGASANALLTAFVTLAIVGTFWGMIKHPRLAFASLLTILGAVYVGWQARGWPSVSARDGLILAVWEMWLGSLRIIWDAIWDVLGLDSVAERLGMSGFGR